MRLRLLAFASASDALGGPSRTVELPDASHVGELRSRLAIDFPRLAPLLPGLAIAIDGELAGDERPLRDGAEVALLPPVSGG